MKITFDKRITFADGGRMSHCNHTLREKDNIIVRRLLFGRISVTVNLHAEKQVRSIVLKRPTIETVVAEDKILIADQNKVLRFDVQPDTHIKRKRGWFDNIISHNIYNSIVSSPYIKEE